MGFEFHLYLIYYIINPKALAFETAKPLSHRSAIDLMIQGFLTETVVSKCFSISAAFHRRRFKNIIAH